MRVAVDRKADAAYVYLFDAPVARTERRGEDRAIDYDADGRVVGLEFLWVSNGVDVRDLLNDPVQEAAVARALEEHRLKIYA